jgi:hypothetical protein
MICKNFTQKSTVVFCLAFGVALEIFDMSEAGTLRKVYVVCHQN